MKKIFHKIHLWLAIPLGLIIFVICLSGAILVFQDEINELTNPNRYFAKETAGEPMAIEELVLKTNSQLTDKTVTSVQIPSDPKRNYVMGLSGQGRANGYVNPYTGELIDTTQRGDGFFSVILRLHRWLLSRDIGKPVVGYTTLFFVFILITGFIIWWPKSKKQLKLRLQVKTKNGWKRFWTDLHTTGGLYLLIGLLVLSLTGLTYSFRWYSKAFYGVLGVELAERGPGGGSPGQGNPNANRQGDDRPGGGKHPERSSDEENTEGGSDNNPHQAERGNKRPESKEVRENRSNKPKLPENSPADSIPQRNYKNRGNRPHNIAGSNDSLPEGERRNHRRRQGEDQNADSASRQDYRGRGRDHNIAQQAGINTTDSTENKQENHRKRENKSQNAEMAAKVPSSPKHAQDIDKTVNDRDSRKSTELGAIAENNTDSVTMTKDHHRDSTPESKQADISHWQSVFNQLKAGNPDFRNISIRDGSATVAQSFTFGNVRASDKYTFDPQTGIITSIELYKDQDKSVKIRGWIYSLHVGAWGGLFSKVLTCIIALFGATLPITGYYFFYIKRKKKAKKVNVSSVNK